MESNRVSRNTAENFAPPDSMIPAGRKLKSVEAVEFIRDHCLGEMYLRIICQEDGREKDRKEVRVVEAEELHNINLVTLPEISPATSRAKTVPKLLCSG